VFDGGGGGVWAGVFGDPEDEAAEFAFVGAEGVRGAVAFVGEDAEVGGDELA